MAARLGDSQSAVKRAPIRSVRFQPRPDRLRDGRIFFAPKWRPAQSVVLAFAVVILVGATLLTLPIASNKQPADFLTALFVATSATTVTGLTPVDTAVEWTGFGQAVILLLIQTGGFGVMTFASLVGLALTRRLGLKARLNASAESRTMSFDDARQVLISIVRIVIVCETVTAALLYFGFVVIHGHDPVRSIWDAVFHAISAFNNAGFSNFQGNLVEYVNSPWICLPISGAIIVGGLGFPVIAQLLKHGFDYSRLTISTKAVLFATPALLLFGTVAFLLLEWNNTKTIGSLDPGTRILASFFQSVQTRTAGFNTLDFGSMESETLAAADVLQFIGGGPAGTAGGIKLTVFLIVAATIVAIIRGDDEVRLFGKRIPAMIVRRSLGIVVIALGLCFLVSFVLLVTTEFTLDQIALEVTSAWGTVGLSTGITSQLPPVAEVALILLMFVGRLGPLTIAAAFVTPTKKLPYELPEERPIIA